MTHLWMWPLLVLAGVGAGVLNSIVGSGTLLTFPTLLAFGVPPVTANVSNNLGLVPGSVTAFYGSRHELQDRRSWLPQMLGWSTAGALTGAFALLEFPEKSFKLIVPFLILFGVALILIQPVLAGRFLAASEKKPTLPVRIGLMGTGIYGGYFGAAQGVILIGLLTSFGGETLPRANAQKNALAGATNLVAGVVFAVIAPVSWRIVLAIAFGSVIGAMIGTRYGRNIPKNAYRTLICVVGLTAALKMWLG